MPSGGCLVALDIGGMTERTLGEAGHELQISDAARQVDRLRSRPTSTGAVRTQNR